MKKFPVQFTVDAASLAAILLFVIWTSNGGLRGEIGSLFQLEGGQQGLRKKVGHGGDILFYYAILAGAVAGAVAVLQWVSRWVPRVGEWVPAFPRVLGWMLAMVQQLIIFLGIYVYLLHRDGAGLKRSKIVLFPFWFLTTIALDVLANAASSILKKVSLNSAALYLKVIGGGLMLAQLANYKPFALI